MSRARFHAWLNVSTPLQICPLLQSPWNQFLLMDSKCGLHKFLLRDTSRRRGLPAPRNMPSACVHIFGHFVQMNDKMFNCAGLS